MNKVRRADFSRTCDGTVMVELAIILPLLLFILFGITELGRALYQQNMLNQAVELGGRYMARVEGAVNTDNCSNDDVDYAVRWDDAVAVAKNLIQCGVDGTAGCAYDPTIPDSGPILPNIIVDEPEVSMQTSSSVSACVITVKATANFQSIFGDDLVRVPGYSQDSEGNLSPLRLEGVVLNAATQERYIGH